MSRPRDLHQRIRSAIKTALEAAAAGGDVGLTDSQGRPLPGYELEAFNLELVTKPCFVCFFSAAELNRGGTNGRDDIAYPVSVALLVTGPVQANEAVPKQSDFRACLSGLFHMKRLSGVPEVLWCETNADTPVVSIEDKDYDQIRTGLAVTAITRTGRG